MEFKESRFVQVNQEESPWLWDVCQLKATLVPLPAERWDEPFQNSAKPFESDVRTIINSDSHPLRMDHTCFQSSSMRPTA
jgi:hypothetical protein